MVIKKRIIIFGDSSSHVSNILIPECVKNIRKISSLDLLCIVDSSRTRQNKTFNNHTTFNDLLQEKILYLARYILRHINGKKSLYSIPFIKQNLGVPIIKPHNGKVNDKMFVRYISKLRPDIILLLGCNQIIKKDLLKIPRIGIINFHWSLLPAYRGRNATYWPIYYGEKITGVTYHFIDEEIDKGKIIIQGQIKISDYDDGESLACKLLEKGKELLRSLLLALASDRLSTTLISTDGKYFSAKEFRKIAYFDPHKCAKENLKRLKMLGHLPLRFGRGLTLYVTRMYIEKKLKKSEISSSKVGSIVEISLKGVAIKVCDGIIRITAINYLPAYIIAKFKKLKKGMRIILN